MTYNAIKGPKINFSEIKSCVLKKIRRLKCIKINPIMFDFYCEHQYRSLEDNKQSSADTKEKIK